MGGALRSDRKKKIGEAVHKKLNPTKFGFERIESSQTNARSVVKNDGISVNDPIDPKFRGQPFWGWAQLSRNNTRERKGHQKSPLNTCFSSK